MVVIGKVVVFGKNVSIWQKWLYSGKSGCIRKSGCICAKVVLFGQKGLYSGKVVVFGQK